MDGSLVATAIGSGLFAGAVAIGATRAIERFGGLVGGVLASLPTTILPASIGLALRLSGGDLQAALYSVPPGMLVNAGFLTVLRVLPPRVPKAGGLGGRLAAAIGVAVAVWAVGAGAGVGITPGGGRTSNDVTAFGGGGGLAVVVVGIPACSRPLPAASTPKPVSVRALVLRGAGSAAAVTVAVLLSRVNRVAAGFATTFPAIFMTAMVSLWLAQGDSLPAGASGPMILGSTSVIAYVVLFSALTVQAGWHPAAALPLAWIIAVCVTSLPITVFLRWRRAVCAQPAAAAVAAGGLAAADANAAAAAGSTADDSSGATPISLVVAPADPVEPPIAPAVAVRRDP